MALVDLASVEQLQQMQELLLKEIKSLRKMAVDASDQLLSAEEAAALVGYNRKTVINWIKDGKKDQRGRKICLEAFEFTPGQYRISKNKLLEYGRVGH